MTQIASLPTLKVEIAFNPTDLTNLTQTWTDCTLYVRDFSTHGGRQHYLDRIEASGLSMTVDNRTGFFMNGTVNGSGSVIRARLPIRITATWNSVTYSVFWGIIDTVDTHLEDALNSDLFISASDSLKYLSLRYAWNEDLYATYANVSSTSSWFNTTNGNSYIDNKGVTNGSVQGGPFALADGVCLYSRTQAVDLTNGGVNPSAYAVIPPTGNQGIEFWVIGQATNNTTLVPVEDTFSANDVSLKVDGNGFPYISGNAGSYTTMPNAINDGYWHHVAYYVSKPAANTLLTLVVDGVEAQTIILRLAGTDAIEPITTNNYIVGQGVACQIDQVIVMGSGITLAQIQNRYIAGSLLRNDRPSGDRVAEALVVGGRGTISSGALSIPNFNINGSAYTPYSASNGTVIAQGSTAPLYTSTVLDIIYDSVDTETGVFFQVDDNGILNYLTKSYPYRASANAAPTGAYVWTDDTTSTYHYDAPSFQLTRDDVDTWTTVIVSPTNGTQQIYSASASNQLLYGQSTLTRSTSPTSLEAAKQTANYLGYIYASPLPRVATVQLRSETDNGSNLDAMLGVQLQDIVTIKRSPINASAAGTTNTQMLVESINHEFVADPGHWHTNFTLDPYALRARTQNSQYYLISDNATFGKSDTNIAL